MQNTLKGEGGALACVKAKGRSMPFSFSCASHGAAAFLSARLRARSRFPPSCAAEVAKRRQKRDPSLGRSCSAGADHGRLLDQWRHRLRARRRADGAADAQLRRRAHLQVRARRRRQGRGRRRRRSPRLAQGSRRRASFLLRGCLPSRGGT